MIRVGHDDNRRARRLHRNTLILRNDGIGLVELVMVLAITAILAAVVTPGILASLPNYRLKSAAHDLHRHVQFARLEAIKRGTQVVIQFTPGAHVFAGRIGSYTLCVDDNLDNDVDVTDNNDQCDAGEPVLLAPLTMPADVSLVGTTFAGDRLVFTPRGIPRTWGNVQLRIGSNMIRSILGELRLSSAGRASLQVCTDLNAVDHASCGGWGAWD